MGNRTIEGQRPIGPELLKEKTDVKEDGGVARELKTRTTRGNSDTGKRLDKDIGSRKKHNDTTPGDRPTDEGGNGYEEEKTPRSRI